MTKKVTKKTKTTASTKNRAYNKKSALIYAIAFAVIGTFLIFRTQAAPRSQPAVTLSLMPGSQTVSLNGTITASVHLNTNGESVNAVQANLAYPTNRLEFVSVDGNGGAFEIQAENTGGNGSVHMARGSLTPINTPDALIGTVTFKAISIGRKINVNFTPESIVARVGDGVNILAKTSGGQYTVR